MRQRLLAVPATEGTGHHAHACDMPCGLCQPTALTSTSPPRHTHQGSPKGSYCEGPYNNGTCKENPADCGQLGKACCRSLSE